MKRQISNLIHAVIAQMPQINQELMLIIPATKQSHEIMLQRDATNNTNVHE